MRQWKIALSLALVGSLAAPFVFRTYKVRPTYSVFIPFTANQKENLASYVQNSNNCQDTASSLVEDFVCRHSKERLDQGGDYESHPDLLKYLALNAGVAVAMFATIFGLAFVIPALLRRYWKWLNT